MNFQELIGKTFSENEVYELIQFELEENMDAYFLKYIHFYFERQRADKIIIREIVNFDNDEDLYQAKRKFIEKREWVGIGDNGASVYMELIHLDRSGKTSLICRDSTRTFPIEYLCWMDEFPDHGEPITPEDIREGFKELMGAMCEYKDRSLGSKKAA